MLGSSSKEETHFLVVHLLTEMPDFGVELLRVAAMTYLRAVLSRVSGDAMLPLFGPLNMLRRIRSTLEREKKEDQEEQ